jgi:hypothetical protein
MRRPEFCVNRQPTLRRGRESAVLRKPRNSSLTEAWRIPLWLA